jgi:hypothetical protein
MVNTTTTWELPNGNGEVVRVHADFIGFASSQGQEHWGHVPGHFASVQARCRACRWFETRIFREVPEPERYLVHFAGVTTVPGEVQLTRVHWAFSADEVVDALQLQRSVNKEPKRCPVCNGTKVVSRPPGVASDQSSWVSSGVGPYPCVACDGKGIILAPGTETFFSIPARRVISQAASFDEEINEAKMRRGL